VKPRDPAWMPAPYSYADVVAVRAVATGEATPEQQKRALDWLIHSAAGAYEISFRSDGQGGDRETAFAEGRRFVGLQLVKLVNLPPALVAQMRDKDA